MNKKLNILLQILFLFNLNAKSMGVFQEGRNCIGNNTFQDNPLIKAISSYSLNKKTLLKRSVKKHKSRYRFIAYK